jgi:DinB superfamily
MPSCAECGYDPDSLDRLGIQQAVTSLAAGFGLLLAATPAGRLRDHPRPGSWSALEYGCHVRDVLRFQRDRVELAQVADTPAFVSMRRDERAIEERYNDQEPAVVAAELAGHAARLAALLAGLDDEGWSRTGLYPWPDPEVRTVEWVGRRAAHELAHHLFDCHRLLGEV